MSLALRLNTVHPPSGVACSGQPPGWRHPTFLSQCLSCLELRLKEACPGRVVARLPLPPKQTTPSRTG
jgi:hypothetical protein